MAKDRSALRAGILMLVSLGLIGAVIVGIKGLAWVSDPSDTHIVAFDLKTNLGGLRVGDEVRIGGYKVGTIQKISLHTRDQNPKIGAHLSVEFSVPRRFQIHEDAVLRIDGTLTGTSWLNFEDLGTGAALKPGTPLRGAQGATQELMAKVSSLAPEISALLAEVRGNTLPKINATVDKFGKTADATTGLITDVQGSYKAIVEKYNAVTDKAVAMMESVRALFGETTEDFRTLIASLRKTGVAFADRVPGILAKVDVALSGVNTAVETVNKTLVELHATAVNAKELSSTARSIVIGNQSKIDGMIDSMKKSGDNLKAATVEIRRSPWRLLYKPGPGEIENLNLYDSARQFAEGANELNSAVAALKDALKDSRTDPQHIKLLMDKVDKSFGSFKDVENKLWSSVRD